jgi:drug/metabolite transporter (DMT)-like permease
MLAVVPPPRSSGRSSGAPSRWLLALSVLYLGLLGTAVAFVWYCAPCRCSGPSRTVIFNNLVPVFGAAFGVLLLGEPLSSEHARRRRRGGGRASCW